MKIGPIKAWILENKDPLVWQRILLRLLPDFREEGFFFHTITDDAVLSPNLLSKIDNALFELYQTRLPDDLIQS